MRVLLFANNRVGVEVARCLRQAGDTVTALVLHPEARRKYGDELIAAAGLDPTQIFTAPDLRAPATLDRIREGDPDIGVSALFGYKIQPPVLALPANGCINLHPSYLPYNRGAYPNVWSIIDRTPAGATLHYMDEHIDTGDIIAQREVPVEAYDTGASLYTKLESAAVELFRDAWPSIRSGSHRRQTQNGSGTHHFVRDVEQLDEIDLDSTWRAGDLVDLLRARSFPPHRGAYFRAGGKRVFLELSLQPEEGESACRP